MRRTVDPGAHDLGDGLLSCGDVLADLLVDIARPLDSLLGRRAVAPFVREVIVFGHIARMAAGGFGQPGVELERSPFLLGPHLVVGGEEVLEGAIRGLGAGGGLVRVRRLGLLPAGRGNQEQQDAEDEERSSRIDRDRTHRELPLDRSRGGNGRPPQLSEGSLQDQSKRANRGPQRSRAGSTGVFSGAGAAPWRVSARLSIIQRPAGGAYPTRPAGLIPCPRSDRQR